MGTRHISWGTWQQWGIVGVLHTCPKGGSVWWHNSKVLSWVTLGLSCFNTHYLIPTDTIQGIALNATKLAPLLEVTTLSTTSRRPCNRIVANKACYTFYTVGVQTQLVLIAWTTTRAGGWNAFGRGYRTLAYPFNTRLSSPNNCPTSRKRKRPEIHLHRFWRCSSVTHQFESWKERIVQYLTCTLKNRLSEGKRSKSYKLTSTFT